MPYKCLPTSDYSVLSAQARYGHGGVNKHKCTVAELVTKTVTKYFRD